MGNYYLPPSGSQINPFQKYGNPGKHHSAKTWTGGQLDLTGSNYGYGAFLISGSDVNGNISVAGGASIAINNFENGRLLEIGVSKVSGSSSPGGEVYVFKTSHS